MVRAQPADLDLYFTWANDPDVRNNSFAQEKIDLNTHAKWFTSRLADNSSTLLVGVLDKVPVGQVRFEEFEAGKLLVNFSVAAEFRGRGLGTELIRSGILAATEQNPQVKEIVAKVKNSNVRSSMVFLAAGFKKTDTTREGVETYVFSMLQ